MRSLSQCAWGVLEGCVSARSSKLGLLNRYPMRSCKRKNEVSEMAFVSLSVEAIFLSGKTGVNRRIKRFRLFRRAFCKIAGCHCIARALKIAH